MANPINRKPLILATAGVVAIVAAIVGAMYFSQYSLQAKQRAAQAERIERANAVEVQKKQQDAAMQAAWDKGLAQVKKNIEKMQKEQKQ